MRERLSAPVQWRAGEWRLLTLCYGRDGTQLWVDGRLTATGAGVAPGRVGWEGTLGLIVGSSAGGLEAANGWIEELTTFDEWPDAEAQQFYHRGVLRTVNGPGAEPGLVQAMDGPPAPGEGGGGGSGGGTNTPAYNYGPGTFYLELLSATNQQAAVRLHNTVGDVMYELLGVTELTNGG